jgi:hypothetical protein
MTSNCEQSRVARQVTFGCLIYNKKTVQLVIIGQYYLYNKKIFKGLNLRNQLWLLDL